MAFNGNPTRIWDRLTPADGDLFNSEFLRSYENHNEHYNFAVAQLNIQKGLVIGRLENYNASPTILRIRRNNVYEVSGNILKLNSELTIGFSSLTNIFRVDGTTPITATSETQNKHLYVLLTPDGSLHAMIVPDSEMAGSSHSYLSNPRLLQDFYSASPTVFDPAKNGYYKGTKRIIGTIRLNASNQIEFWYALGHGQRFMDTQDIAIGNKFVETRWKREHPSCYVPDGSTVAAMATEAPVLHRILGSTTLPSWMDRFPRNIDNIAVGVGRSIRDIQEDALQGFLMRINNVTTDAATSGGATGFWRQISGSRDTSSIITDGVNGTPRIASETRGKNFAESIQIVRG